MAGITELIVYPLHGCCQQARAHAVAGITELNLTVERLPGFYRQRDNRMYSTLSFITPVTLLRLPYSFAISLVWSAMVSL